MQASPPTPPSHQLWNSSDSLLTPFNSTPAENTIFFLSVWSIKHINPSQGRGGECQSGPFGGSGPIAHPAPRGASREQGARSVTRTGPGRASEKAREEQGKETAVSGGRITSSILFSSQASTSSADGHLQGGCGRSGQVPTSCRVGRRDGAATRQMQPSGKPSTFTLNRRGTWAWAEGLESEVSVSRANVLPNSVGSAGKTWDVLSYQWAPPSEAPPGKIHSQGQQEKTHHTTKNT